MKHCLRLSALILGCVVPVSTAQAGAVDHKTNLSAEWVRLPSRNALSNSVDAVAYNPAGVTKLPEGAHVNLSSQTVYVDLAHEASFGSGVREFPSSNIVPAVPGLYMLYRLGRWAAYGSFNIPGGGGTLEYPDGSYTTAVMEVAGAAALEPLALPIADPSELGLATKVSSIYYGGVVGGAYAFNDVVSLSLGARYIKGSRNIQMTTDAGLVEGLFGTDTLVDQKESAQGFGGILSVHVTPMENLSLSLRYESKVALDWNVDQSDIPVLLLDRLSPAAQAQLRSKVPAEGTVYDHDLPATASLGAAYRVIPALELSWSFNYFFQQQADWSGNEEFHKDAWEMGLGGEYRATQELLLSLGVLFGHSGVKHRGYLAENPALPFVSLGLGGRYQIQDGLAATLGAMYVHYLPDTYWPEGAPAVDLTRKRATMGSLGVEWKFL